MPNYKNKAFFVYRLTLKSIRYFYFGITNDIDKRKSEHICGVHMAFKAIKGEIKRSNIKKAYFVVAQCLIDAGIPDVTFNMIKTKLVFKIIDIKDSRLDAADNETNLINKYSKSKWLLNNRI